MSIEEIFGALIFFSPLLMMLFAHFIVENFKTEEERERDRKEKIVRKELDRIYKGRDKDE